MTTIEGQMIGQVEQKRLTLPGIVLKSVCPKCGLPVRRDFGFRYLSYPLANAAFDVHLTCESETCFHEWPVRVVLKISLELESVVDQIAGLAPP